MHDFPSIPFAIAFSDPWVIPTLGVVVTALAFLVGHFFLSGKKAAAAPLDVTTADDPGTEHKDIFLHGSYGDRRTAPRRRGNCIEVDLCEDPARPMRHAWVLDRSVGGLCLVVEEPIAEGTQMHVRPRSAGEGAPWILIEIKGCRAHKNEWEVNCMFLQTPSWNVMMQFG
jgi:hypothetical protein